MFSCNFFLFPTFWFPIIILVLSFHPFYAAYLLSLASPVRLPVYDCSLRFCLCLVPCGCVLFFCDYCICGTENCRITVLFYSIYTISGDAPKTSEFKPSQIKLLEMSISNMYILFFIWENVFYYTEWSDALISPCTLMNPGNVNQASLCIVTQNLIGEAVDAQKSN